MNENERETKSEFRTRKSGTYQNSHTVRQRFAHSMLARCVLSVVKFEHPDIYTATAACCHKLPFVAARTHAYESAKDIYTN